MQLTPPGSACSIAIGEGLTDMAPGSQHGDAVVVADAEAARAQLGPTGSRPARSTSAVGPFVYFADPDGNTWALQELPARADYRCRSGRRVCGVGRPARGDRQRPGRRLRLAAQAAAPACRTVRAGPVPARTGAPLGHGDWTPPADRPDPVQQVIDQNLGRQPWLVPVRIGRMISSPYAFLRGSANIMADDFAALPATGITPVICGDAHLGNFGFYASPERELVFDLNDFDEAHPGAWEWDLRRLVVSVYVAGRQNGFPETPARTRCSTASRSTGSRSRISPSSRCSAARSTGWTWTGCGRRPPGQLPGGDRAGRPAGPPAHQRPRAAPLHRAPGRHVPAGRGAAADHPADRGRARAARPRRWTATSTRCRRTGRGSSPATGSSTSRTRWSGSGRWGCGRTWRCARAAARTTWCSCSSSRPADR